MSNDILSHEQSSPQDQERIKLERFKKNLDMIKQMSPTQKEQLAAHLNDNPEMQSILQEIEKIA